MVVGEVLDEKAVMRAVEGNDVIYNFAGIADIDENSRRPLDAVRVNILGNTILLEAARHFRLKRFVFASSAYVFSNAGMIYRSTKRACEDLIDDYKKLFGLDYTILRYGSLYGPRAGKGNTILHYIRQALEKKKIVSVGQPDDIREYIHVEDAAASTVKILEPEFANQNIILTGKQAMRVKDLLKMIDEILGGVEVQYSETTAPSHYSITPYSFSPRMGRKLVSNMYVDLGQGLLYCIEEVYREMVADKERGGAEGGRQRAEGR